MAILQLDIPDEALADFEVLSALGPAALNEAYSRLSRMGAVLSGAELERVFREIAADEMRGKSVFRAVVSLAVPFTNESTGKSEGSPFLAGVTHALQSKWDSQKQKVTAWGAILPHMEKIVALSSLRLYSKSMELRAEREHLLRSARIITDLRPIFLDSDQNGVASIQLSASVVVHALRLRFTARDGSPTELHIALDRGDLEKLRAACDRALNKEDSLNKQTKGTVLQSLSSAEE